MSLSFGDVQAAARMRDLTEKISAGVVDRMRPEPRLGMVHHYDSRAQAAWIQFKGDTDLVMARTAENMVPTRSIESHGESLANIVRVAGKPGSYYVMDFIRGGPKPFLSIESMHKNADFELGAIGLTPPNWTDFWNNGAVYARLDDSVYQSGRQSCKVTIPAGVGNNLALQTLDVISVTPGEVIEIGCSAVSDNPNANIKIQILTNSVGGDPNFFAPGVVPNDMDSYLPGVLRFSTIATTFEVPAGQVVARIIYRVTTTDGSAANVWIDDTWSKSKGNPYETVAAGPGIWINHVANLNMPNVFKSVGYARYTTIGNTLIYQGGVVIVAPGVISQVLIDLPDGMDWGPGEPYLISIGWQLFGPPIGKVHGVRSGSSWYEGVVVPFSMKAGATPARATVVQIGTSGPTDGTSGGGAWNATTPITWQAGDVWTFAFTAEIAPRIS